MSCSANCAFAAMAHGRSRPYQMFDCAGRDVARCQPARGRAGDRDLDATHGHRNANSDEAPGRNASRYVTGSGHRLQGSTRNRRGCEFEPCRRGNSIYARSTVQVRATARMYVNEHNFPVRCRRVSVTCVNRQDPFALRSEQVRRCSTMPFNQNTTRGVEHGDHRCSCT